MLTDQLRQRIAESDLSLYQIAKQTGVDLSQLSKFRHQGHGLSLSSAGRVCELLGVELKVGDDDESPATTIDDEPDDGIQDWVREDLDFFKNGIDAYRGSSAEEWMNVAPSLVAELAATASEFAELVRTKLAA